MFPNSSPVDQVNAEYFTYAEAVSELGISKMSLWRWIRRGKVEVEKLGREVFILKSQVAMLKAERNRQ